MARKFLRRTWSRFSKLGKGRKKKQKWRRATGRDNKIREKRKGYPVKVMIGFKQKKDKEELKLIRNINDIEKIKKGEHVLIGKLGAKKRTEILKKAKEKGIIIKNLNANKMLKKVEKMKNMKKKQEEGKESEKKIKKEKSKEIIKDIEKSGVSEKVAKAEEALDEKAQIKNKENKK